MKKENKLLFVAQSPGGFNALFPVIKKIKVHPNHCRVFLCDKSRIIAGEHNMRFVDCTGISQRKLVGLLDEFNPNIIITATNEGLNLEKVAICWAQKRTTPCLSVVDFWSNYRLRFSRPGSSGIKYAPDAVCVIDTYMEEQMIAEGFDKSRLRITGNPYFDTFKKSKSSKAENILFVSQPFSEIFSKLDNKVSAISPIFNEVEIFADYVGVLESLEVALPIVVSLHPRCVKKRKYSAIIAKSKLDISISEEDTLALLHKAKLVCGINSAVLFQAAVIGRKVISYQPGITRKQDVFINNRLGFSYTAHNPKKLKEQIKLMLNRTARPKELKEIREKYTNNNSTQKVITVINEFLAGYAQR